MFPKVKAHGKVSVPPHELQAYNRIMHADFADGNSPTRNTRLRMPLRRWLLVAFPLAWLTTNYYGIGYVPPSGKCFAVGGGVISCGGGLIWVDRMLDLPNAVIRGNWILGKVDQLPGNLPQFQFSYWWILLGLVLYDLHVSYRRTLPFLVQNSNLIPLLLWGLFACSTAAFLTAGWAGRGPGDIWSIVMIVITLLSPVVLESGRHASHQPMSRARYTIIATIIVVFSWLLGEILAHGAHRSPNIGDVVSLMGLPVGLLVLVRGLLANRRWPPPGHCHKCGYNLFGNVSGICPECGSAINVQ